MWVEEGCINDVRIGDFHGCEVRFQRVSNKDRIWGDDLLKPGLNIRKRHLRRCHVHWSDARVAADDALAFKSSRTYDRLVDR